MVVGVAAQDEWPILLLNSGCTWVSVWSDGALPVIGGFCFFLESVGVTYAVNVTLIHALHGELIISAGMEGSIEH